MPKPAKPLSTRALVRKLNALVDDFGWFVRVKRFLDADASRKTITRLIRELARRAKENT